MSQPRAEEIVDTVIASLEGDLLPELETSYARQTARLLVGLLHQVEARLRHQEQALRADNAALRTLLEELRGAFAGRGGRLDTEAATISGALGRRDDTGPAGGSSLETVIRESEQLREGLDRAMRALFAHEADFAPESFSGLHDRVRAYLAAQVERDGAYQPPVALREG